MSEGALDVKWSEEALEDATRLYRFREEKDGGEGERDAGAAEGRG